MSKKIEFTFEGTDYVLEYTRRTVKDMERDGFTAKALATKPLTMYPILFEGAFKCHHKRVDKETIDRIYKAMPKKDELLEALGAMYGDVLESLFEEPEDSEKNVEWKTNF